jgi:NAD(P)-dependent dehydrogenase (short-subunit alcohol dehydrogenase family)
VELLVNLSFENKVALVTGAASGIGLATARAFAEAGAAVALADVSGAAVRSAAEDLVAAGRKAIGIRCDVAVEAEVAAMVEQTVSTFGRLDAAFNNAGVQAPAGWSRGTARSWSKLRDRPRTCCGWRVHRTVSDEIIERCERMAPDSVSKRLWNDT